MKLKLLENEFTIYKLPKSTDIGKYISDEKYIFVGITPEELSLTIDSNVSLSDYINKIDWRKILELQGVFEFSDSNVWITAKLSGILAEAGVSLCFVGMHDTDYIMVSINDLSSAINAFEAKWVEIIK